jgi:pyruvate formate lyase activating enzyme
MGFNIGLHTSGVYPSRLAEVLTRLDWVGLDIKHLPQSYAKITGVEGSGERVLRSLTLMVENGIDFETRTTLHPSLISPSEQREIAIWMKRTGVYNHRFQSCRLESCLDPSMQSLNYLEPQLSDQTLCQHAVRH